MPCPILSDMGSHVHHNAAAAAEQPESGGGAGSREQDAQGFGPAEPGGHSHLLPEGLLDGGVEVLEARGEG